MIKITDKQLSKVAEKFGTRYDSLSFLGGGREDSDGIVYSYKIDDRDMVLKVLAIPIIEKEAALKKIKERIHFINFLGENGVDIAYPLLNCNNNLLETIEIEKYVLLAYTMNRIEGSHPKPDDYSKEFYYNYGKTVGNLHKIAKKYSKWKGTGIDGDCDVLGWQDEWNIFYNWCSDDEVKKCWTSMKDVLSNLPFTRDTHGFIHNDPHTENILVNKNKIVLIDFDVANFNWFAADIAIASQSLLFSVTGGMERPITDISKLKYFYEHFLKGYETENHLDNYFIENIDIFINYRRMLLFTVLQDWLATEPDKKESWKNMILNSPKIRI